MLLVSRLLTSNLEVKKNPRLSTWEFHILRLDVASEDLESAYTLEVTSRSARSSYLHFAVDLGATALLALWWVLLI